MATISPQRSGIGEFARTLGGIWMLFWFGGSVAGLLTRLATLPPNANNKPTIAALLVLSGAIFGAFLAAHHARKIDPNFRDYNFIGTARSALNGFDEKKNTFLSIASGFTCLYVGGFLIAIERFPAVGHDGWPLSLLVIGVTAATIGAQTYFAIRYASFIRMLTALGTLMADGRRNLAQTKRDMIADLRESVFRDEQLYEPPGNIFVTMGITATFLGLAVGLSTMDLTAIAKKQDFSTATSFIGCMGLALGISMLGVLVAMASQWLRGHGPRLSTELLLERALEAVEAPAAPGQQTTP